MQADCSSVTSGADTLWGKYYMVVKITAVSSYSDLGSTKDSKEAALVTGTVIKADDTGGDLAGFLSDNFAPGGADGSAAAGAAPKSEVVTNAPALSLAAPT